MFLLVWLLEPKLIPKPSNLLSNTYFSFKFSNWKWLEYFQTFWTSSTVFVGTSTKYDVNILLIIFGLKLSIKKKKKRKKEKFRSPGDNYGAHRELCKNFKVDFQREISIFPSHRRNSKNPNC